MQNIMQTVKNFDPNKKPNKNEMEVIRRSTFRRKRQFKNKISTPKNVDAAEVVNDELFNYFEKNREGNNTITEEEKEEVDSF